MAAGLSMPARATSTAVGLAAALALGIMIAISSQRRLRTTQLLTTPRPVVTDSECERFWRRPTERPCAARRRRSTLCVHAPQRRITAADYVELLTSRRFRPEHVRVQIVAGRVYVVPHPLNAFGHPNMVGVLRKFLANVQDAAAAHALPDVDAVLNVADESPGWPVLANHYRADAEPTFLVPGIFPNWDRAAPAGAFGAPDAAAKHAGVARGTTRYEPAPDVPDDATIAAGWDARQPRAVWRGSLTGPPVSARRWEHNMRARLTALSRAHPLEVDAAFTEYQGAAPEAEEARVLESALRRAPRMPFAEFASFRLSINADGNGQSDRLTQLLRLGGLVLSVSDVHVPLSENSWMVPHAVWLNGSELGLVPLAVRCLHVHSERALSMALAGAAFARAHLTYRNTVVNYWADALDGYSAAQAFPTRLHPHAIDAERLRLRHLRGSRARLEPTLAFYAAPPRKGPAGPEWDAAAESPVTRPYRVGRAPGGASGAAPANRSETQITAARRAVAMVSRAGWLVGSS